MNEFIRNMLKQLLNCLHIHKPLTVFSFDGVVGLAFPIFMNTKLLFVISGFKIYHIQYK